MRGLGLVRLGCLCSFIHVPPTWQFLTERIAVGPRDPDGGERAKVLGAGLGVTSSQLGAPKQVAALAPVFKAGKWGPWGLPWMSE